MLWRKYRVSPPRHHTAKIRFRPLSAERNSQSPPAAPSCIRNHRLNVLRRLTKPQRSLPAAMLKAASSDCNSTISGEFLGLHFLHCLLITALPLCRDFDSSSIRRRVDRACPAVSFLVGTRRITASAPSTALAGGSRVLEVVTLIFEPGFAEAPDEWWARNGSRVQKELAE